MQFLGQQRLQPLVQSIVSLQTDGHRARGMILYLLLPHPNENMDHTVSVRNETLVLPI